MRFQALSESDQLMDNDENSQMMFTPSESRSSMMPSTSGLQRRRKAASSAKSSASATSDYSDSSKLHLKEMAVTALKSLSHPEPKDQYVVFGEFVASEFRSLPPELAAIGKTRLRRALIDIMEELAPVVCVFSFDYV